jgi:hypothetical protein
MTVRRGIRAAAVTVAAAIAAACDLSKPVVVACTSENGQVLDVVRLNPLRGQATLVSVSPPLSGTVQSSPTEHDVVFQPGPDGSPRLRLRINRYTFRSMRELGAEGAAGVTPSPGLCERYKGKPL